MSFDYAASLTRMEEIRDQLENSTTDLNESLKLYEEGIGLYREMKAYLDDMERKFELIRTEADDDQRD